MTHAITLNLNGETHRLQVEARRTLVDVIREECGATGTHTGCEHGVCGRLHRVAGRHPRPVLPDVRRASQRPRHPHRRGLGTARHPASPAAGRSSTHHALQCGYCTPGFLMLAVGMLEAKPADR